MKKIQSLGCFFELRIYYMVINNKKAKLHFSTPKFQNVAILAPY